MQNGKNLLDSGGISEHGDGQTEPFAVASVCLSVERGAGVSLNHHPNALRKRVLQGNSCMAFGDAPAYSASTRLCCAAVRAVTRIAPGLPVAGQV
jgi:hypothetical protein